MFVMHQSPVINTFAPADFAEPFDAIEFVDRHVSEKL